MNGLLNIRKPTGLSSRRVVDVVERAAGACRVGHAGTLDPLATGVLIVCVGAATRLIPYLQNQRKSYAAEFLLGQRSDTDDVTGRIEDVPVACPPSREVVEIALARFRGVIRQIPPDFSAVHVDGQRAYARARRGKPVDLEPREVEVYRLDLTGFDYPRLQLEIDCGSGTYVRSIARDLGEVLGCGAVMSRLVRTAIGSFSLNDGVALAGLTRASLRESLLPPLAAVAHFPRQVCSAVDVQSLSTGRAVRWRSPAAPPSDTVCLTGPGGGLVAICRFQPDIGMLAPQQVFVRHDAPVNEFRDV